MGTIGASMAAYAIYSGNFTLLCIASFTVGIYHASGQYFRFAAAESVPPKAAPKAMSYVLLGSIVAAIIVPPLASEFNAAYLPFTFMGAFIMLICATLLAQIPFLFMTSTHEYAIADKSAVEMVEGHTVEKEARPLSLIIKQASFWVAIVNAGLGYAMMSFVMTATPLAMDSCGFAADTSAGVIRWHVIGMFLPGLFTGSLIARFGILRVLMMGHILFALAFAIAMWDIQIENFSLGLIALGIGWNFCFIGGTALLTGTYHDNERSKVQALSETIIISLTALASFSAGIALSYYGWQWVNQMAFVLLIVASVVTLLYAFKISSAQREKA